LKKSVKEEGSERKKFEKNYNAFWTRFVGWMAGLKPYLRV
jgi:hypothetical protein